MMIKRALTAADRVARGSASTGAEAAFTTSFRIGAASSLSVFYLRT
jgi:hypothetical protein